MIDPAIEALVRAFPGEWEWAQVLIRREGERFELRHVKDQEAAVENLRNIPVAELRALAMHTEKGVFRPLKAAPDLRTGWRCVVQDVGELSRAIDLLYPGSVADWFATRAGEPPVTDYREFTGRQTGMYRVTTFLDDTQAAEVAAACCHPRFCLKQRLWTVGELRPDGAEGKSLIPCLEPCAVLLEMARKAARIEQEEKTTFELGASELESLVAGLELSVEQGAGKRVADFGSPTNPRRLQVLLEKFRKRLEVGSSTKKEE